MEKLKNKKNLKLLILILSVIVLMFIMFYLSSQNGFQSHRLSRGVLKFIKGLAPFLSMGSSPLKIMTYDFLIRKIAHFTEYFLLAVFIYFSLRGFKIIENKAKKITIGICFLFAITDEIHQIFVIGRNSLLRDVLIDLLGSLFAMFMIGYILKKRRKLKF